MPSLSQSLSFTVNNTSTVTGVTYPNTATTTMVYVSSKVKGDGYYGSSDGLHTSMYATSQDFHGTVTMQASLASEPIESDWFNVQGTSVVYTPLDARTTDTIDYSNFTGNFVWVRGYIAINDGAVLSIQYNR